MMPAGVQARGANRLSTNEHLHQNRINGLVFDNRINRAKQSIRGNVARRPQLNAANAQLLAGLDFLADVNLRCRIVAYQNHR
jgi:hypothetical protein